MAWYLPDKEPGSGASLGTITSGADDAWIRTQAARPAARNGPRRVPLKPINLTISFNTSIKLVPAKPLLQI